ncbi:hypothetical protein [Vibrio phage vB_VhaS-a]|nr:hypothetical protein [Vibrio phage vB_VhaS-a]
MARRLYKVQLALRLTLNIDGHAKPEQEIHEYLTDLAYHALKYAEALQEGSKIHEHSISVNHIEKKVNPIGCFEWYAREALRGGVYGYLMTFEIYLESRDSPFERTRLKKIINPFVSSIRTGLIVHGAQYSQLADRTDFSQYLKVI